MLGDVSCIYSVPIFRVLPDESVENLEQVLEHRHFLPGQQVMRTGDKINYLYVVSRGHLTLSRTSRSGREQILRELHAGDFFGETALFADVESEGDVTAVSATNVCLLSRHAVHDELQKAPGLAWPLLEAIASRLAEAERMIGHLSLLDVEGRLADHLLRMAETGTKLPQGIKVTIDVSWAKLAGRLGTTPESLSRRLKALSDGGYISVDGHDVIIVNPEGLREFVD